MNKKQSIASGLFFSFFAIQPVFAEEAVELEQVVVTEKETKANLIQKSRKAVQQEMINDSRDLVRYTTDVGISDNGRHLKGFAMRGVEGNRVSISIDGVSLPDSEENSLYGRYGNFNSSRLSIDPELTTGIDIYRGANSFNSGSGSLGGSVNYKTLDAVDLVSNGNRFGGLAKAGYSSKNREWVKTVGVGYLGEKLDVALLYSHRAGHELKSNGRGDIELFSARQKPDPVRHRTNNYLFKLGYAFNPEHRVAFSINGQKGSRYTDELSYTSIGSLWREADDQNKRVNANVNYAFTPESKYLALFKTDIDYQYTDLAAVNYKGLRSWNFLTNQSNPKELMEIYDRRMKTKYTRVSMQADSQPFEFPYKALGEHQLSVSAFVGRRDFKNINYDTIIGAPTSEYTIQYPVRTTQLGATIKDKVVWNPTFDNWSPIITAQFGSRFNYEKLTPQELNAACSAACKREGKPDKAIFKTVSSFLDLEAQLNDVWKVGYNVGSGYRIPTASEMYFTFDSPYGKWQSNPDLRAERSITHTLSVVAEDKKGSFDLNLYQSNYKDFLFEQETIVKNYNIYYRQCAYYGCSRYFETPRQQMVNIDKARIRGLEAKLALNLGSFTEHLNGWKVSGAVGYSKGKLSTESSLLSIQPVKAILGLDYEATSGKWGIFNRLTYLGAKKAKDAQVVENVYSSRGYAPKVTTYKYLNKSAYVFDLFGYYKATKNITLRAGVYNLFNRTYHTWDALRGINANSTTNVVDRDGKGLQRFYAPGRNYSASIEIKF
ncbi:Hemoglobin receptor [Mannheimia sp. USDA-ARS-USMARC-1261]|uniref:TonB-dependent hemoglobin/transferrin/lactoferrin family receptor n=1 Tax=Mannheimia sp. USDA-ARS-USMARC-1261 TaxID=1432056 RepID=UPI0003E33B53|nr:TonB-dependent hemoglobin/transferrin/lactoferrin family receptor [Mannheimia sp. USDA-ARS-USMARC-1261]AHG72613.1 Hemoglobin receptor [Mannheimia sp. USDA-ARS-USMARC-1261]